jgi:hypothetical protein
MPTTGPSPKSLEPIYDSVVGITENPFTLQKQVQDWQAHRSGMSVTMPPMPAAQAATWVDFLISLDGMANVFQITDSTWLSLIPSSAAVSGYWCLAKNQVKWSINDGIFYGLQFEIEEVK